jgi:sulfite reductase (NADPH) flavoprotein alpha-component
MSTIFDRSHPFLAKIIERYPLTKEGSTKRTYHISLSFDRASLPFNVGDSFGVYGQNDPLLVHHLLEAIDAKAETVIIEPRSLTQMSLWSFLSFKANLSRLTSPFLKLFYEHVHIHDKKNELGRLLNEENKVLLAQYLSCHDPLDLFKEFRKTSVPLQELCNRFSPLLPRFYSAASSLSMVPNAVDLVVALFTFTHSNEKRYGVASHFLCNLAEMKTTDVPIYVQPAHCFALPLDLNASLIMIGPGTGIAPFRAFMQERLHRGATGKHWLFFGERHREFDYFYETFWEDLVRQGKLRLDLAFSRDQPEKLYVQHKMYEHRKELWSWVQEGAYLYLSGDAHKMAKDVEAMLVTIFKEQGNLSEEAAKAHLKALRTQKRYLIDVY